jgi:glycosyltransferase involved in cell wall biosynthesis/SAM-dependent methyltransferase
MQNRPLVSVIMIFLNEERFLQEAIDSVFAQTYQNWELLLVDDGSTDDSTRIAQSHAAQYPGKVCYLEHEGHQNRGMSTSRNLGISQAKGEYIAFLDADDVWLPHKLERQAAIMVTQPNAAMVCGRAQWWYSWTGNAGDSQYDFVQRFDVPLDTVVQPPTLLILFLKDEWASLCDILVRREVVEAVGGYEESFYGMYEDQAFHAKLCLRFPAFVSAACGYRYRQHPGARTARSHETGATYAARQTFLKWLEVYLSRQGVKNGTVWQVVQNELWPYRHPILARISRRGNSFVDQKKGLMIGVGRRILPAPVRHWLWTKWRRDDYRPPVGWVRFGSLRRVTPISRHFGFDRGLPIDRYYVEDFLARYADDIRGHVLEIGDETYTRRMGGDRVTRSDVLHVEEGNPKATCVADLTRADQLPSDTFDCIILTQTLPFIYDVRAAVMTIYRILKPGGVALVTVPGITQIDRESAENWGQYWSFTKQSAKRIFDEVFPSKNVTAEAHGNVLAASAFLYGIATQELHRDELDYHDPNYDVIIAVRAVRP